MLDGRGGGGAGEDAGGGRQSRGADFGSSGPMERSGGGGAGGRAPSYANDLDDEIPF